MLKPNIPQGSYFSPCFQLERFVGLQEKHGEGAFTERKFQAERESWIAAVFLLGYSQLTQQDWWLMPAADPPDIIAVTTGEREKGPTAQRLDIEIFEYEKNSPMNDLVGTIQRKLAKKAYPEHYQVVCYVHHHPGEPFNPGETSDQLKALNLRVSYVWLVASIESQNPSEYVLVRLLLEPYIHPFDYRAACKDNRLPDSIDLLRGTGKKPTTFGWRKIDLP